MEKDYSPRVDGAFSGNQASSTPARHKQLSSVKTVGLLGLCWLAYGSRAVPGASVVFKAIGGGTCRLGQMV